MTPLGGPSRQTPRREPLLPRNDRAPIGLQGLRYRRRSDSLILREAAATLANVRGAVQRAIEENRVRPDDQMTVAMVHAALQAPRDATLQLAALATRKLQHAFTDLLHGERARAAFASLTDYQTIAFRGTAGRGATELLNITRIVAEHELNTPFPDPHRTENRKGAPRQEIARGPAQRDEWAA